MHTKLFTPDSRKLTVYVFAFSYPGVNDLRLRATKCHTGSGFMELLFRQKAVNLGQRKE